jgi:hypothetical protein
LASDEIAGELMTVGGLLGFLGTVSTVFPFSVMGVLSFGLVTAFGILVIRNRPEARIVAAATLWFAPLGGLSCAITLWFNHTGWLHSDLWDAQSFVGLLGTSVALTGAVLMRRVARP